VAKLILHIGTHKTATTTVQDTFYANRALLADYGVIYPDLGRHTGHHGLLTDWVALPETYKLRFGGIGTLRALAEQYVDGDKTLFLSSEEFSRGGGHGGQVDMRALADIFAGFQSIQIICFLREQWQFLQSVYLEIARTRIPDRPLVLVDTALKTGVIDGLWCDYRNLYDHLRTGFLAEDIHFVDYGSAREFDGGVLGQLLSILDLPFDVQRLTQVNNAASNVSGLPLPTWAGFTIADGLVTDVEFKSAVTTAFELEFGTDAKSCLFTRKEMKQISNHFEPKNTELVNRIRTVQPGFKMTAGFPERGTIYREDLAESFWVRSARRIYLSSLVKA